MSKAVIAFLLFGPLAIWSTASRSPENPAAYANLYREKIADFRRQQLILLQCIENGDPNTDREKIKRQLNLARDKMKAADFWLRYLDPLAYKKINGPLPVEWETEVFEKFEKPYKRIGSGLTLAALYLEKPAIQKDSLRWLIQESVTATGAYQSDSITQPLQSYAHFFGCNRLYLLNLAAIYTTGFECPDAERIIPELRGMMEEVKGIYQTYEGIFPEAPLSEEYLKLYDSAIAFVQNQAGDYRRFDHFAFIQNYIDPLFSLNQRFIREYQVVSASFVDYSLNDEAHSIFEKDLYYAQNPKGVFLRVNDQKALTTIDEIGKLLFYDPILSGNNARSCASCHHSDAYFTDTAQATALQFNRRDRLPRNTPSLLNVGYNHLVMLDGKHSSLQNQLKAVIANPLEMGGNPAEVLEKVLSCPDYKKAFEALLRYTPQETGVTMDHIASAITLYYSKFSDAYAPFDEAMREHKPLPPSAVRGFNLFMSKARCGTCHFVPQFNGVKPPYVSSEFEVLGVPKDEQFTGLSADAGRYEVNPAPEMRHAFRTGSLRNAAHTRPYMHNGVFTTLEEVIDFYDAGGGVGKGLQVDNQTLSSDSLHLTATEKADLLAFIHALDEKIDFDAPPAKLPASKNKSLNSRKVGGEY